MICRTRIKYTAAQKIEMWGCWQRGESLHWIARQFDRHHTSVRGILAATGGIRPRERRRSHLSLTLAEREQISRGIMVACHSIRSIAKSLGRAPSTISREIRLEGSRRRYRTSEVDQAAWDRAQRPKPCKLVVNRALARILAQKLRELWSPEQIAGWLKCAYPNDMSHQVSHETIYCSLFIPGPWRIEKGAPSAPQEETGHALIAAQSSPGYRTGSDHRHRLDP